MTKNHREKKTRVVWDKTNIGENYPGITAPLTYSFIRDAYARVYYHFMELMGVKGDLLNAYWMIFANLIGYIQGQVFYNINHWYELLKLLPGYRYNKIFFENMLNPVEAKTEDGPEGFRLGALWQNRRVLTKLLRSILFTESLHKRFEQGFEVLWQSFKGADIGRLSNFELVAFFEKLERDFFGIWAITIVNDFKVMLYFGLLRRFSEKFFPEPDQILDDIYSRDQPPRSVAPMRQLMTIAELIDKNLSYRGLFEKDVHSILGRLSAPEFTGLQKVITQYIDAYGERVRNELKLEEANFKENPAELVSLLKCYLQMTCSSKTSSMRKSKDPQRFDSERSSPKTALFPYRLVLNYLRANTIASIHRREEYRMKRGKAFNLAREMFFEMGRRLQQAGNLNELDDVFFLYQEEIFDYLRFHRLPEGFSNLIDERKTLLREYGQNILPRRVMTIGLPGQELVVEGQKDSDRKNLQGQSTSKGLVQEAEVIVMPTLDLNVNFRNKILVTRATDPGWTIIFPLLKGVVTEEGGMLSHASIVAREIGIPCIVKVADVTQILHSGDRIQMDAHHGQITVLT